MTEEIILEKVGDDVKHIFPNWTSSVAKEYSFKKKLGKGGFGQVWLCEQISSKELMACKVINKSAFSKSTLQSFHDEVTLMQTLIHPGIIKFIGGYETKKKLYILLEPCNGGELYAKVIARNKITEKDCASWTRQLVEVLKYCHGRGVIHCDLKPENVLFVDDTAVDIRVIDFGLSKVRRKHEWISKVGGTPMYIAPECLDRHYSESCDIWSTGVMVFEMLHGYLPFEVASSDPKAPIMLAKKGLNAPSKKRGPNINTKFGLSQKAIDFITQVLIVEPSGRPDAAEVLLHPWLTDKDASEKPLTHVLGEFKKRNAMNGVQKFIKNMIHSDDIQSWVVDDVRKTFTDADKDGDGKLAWEEFNEAIKQLSGEMSHVECLALFDIIDEDHDHNVDIDEFIRHFAFEHCVKHDDFMWEVCKKLDADGNKKISKQEMNDFMKSNPDYGDKIKEELGKDLESLFAKGDITYDQLICACGAN